MPLQLVAHRGLPFQFPENSLLGFEQAIRQGANWLETDVRLTADAVPILFHDPTAERLCGLPAPIAELPLAQLQRYGVFHPTRFASRFRGLPVSTLRQFCQLLRCHRSTRAFVELKLESAVDRTAPLLVSRLLATIEDMAVGSQVTAISFHPAVLRELRQRAGLPIGLVCSDWHPVRQAEAAALQPDFLLLESQVCASLLPTGAAGPWRLGVYTVNDLKSARHMLARGVELLETDRWDELVGQL